MKWIALALLCANVALWWAVGKPQPVSSVGDSAGRLPRVVQLKQAEGRPPRLLAPASDGIGLRSDDSGDNESVVGRDSADEVHVQKYCFRLGWFDDEASAAVAIDNLSFSDVTDVSIRKVERPKSPLYWVLVPPEKTKSAALKRLRDIRRLGIDSYLVTKGEQKYAISLGLFESKSAAERVLAQENKKNLHATLVLFPRNRLSYALVFEATYVPGSKELGEVEADLSSQFELLEIKRCESVATAEKNP